MKLSIHKILFISVLLISCIVNGLYGQSILTRKISLSVVNQRLGNVMSLMEEKGAFGFSYASKIVPQDSIVNLQADGITIKEALDLLLNEHYEYRETKNFIVLRYAPLRLSLITDKAWGDQNFYTISGYVVDEHDNKKIHNASVYEKYLAQATLTDEDGHFEIVLHHIYQPIALTASKENYKNVTNLYLSEVNIQQQKKHEDSNYSSGDFEDIANIGFARFLTSAKQQIHSLNLGGVISQAPYQLSLTPAINTHGTFSGQIVNDVSLNLVGGYNAGVDGVEVGGIFNINKMDVKGFQLAGLFNISGGSVSGAQLSGVYNDVWGNVDGIQLTGIKNNIKGSRTGIQLAGLFNNVQKNSSGFQMAGLFNSVHGKISGIQIAGLFNQADQSDGLQIGLINMAGSSTGYSLGLLNFIGNGYNKVSLGYNETIDLNIALKTGTKKLYTLWLGGMNAKKDNKLYAFGLGLGTAIDIKKWLTLNPELSCRYIYQGNWKNRNLLNRFDLGFNFKVGSGFSITTGPSANIFYSNQDVQLENYAYVQNRTDRFSLNNSKLRGWIGWGAAITIF
jgi:hypothetical protein